MSIIKYIATADTTITNAFKPNTLTRAFYANLGAADSLELFSISHTGSAAEKSRVLIRFPIDKIIENRNAGIIPQSGSMNFILRVFNVAHPETLPKNYDILIKPISGSWDEGFGLDLETYSDNGQMQGTGYGVGWKFRSTTDSPFHWFSDGGDFWEGYDKTFHVENGTEDIELDITDALEAQINGTISQDGFGLMLSGSFEEGLDGQNYYTKRFSARSSEYFYKLPCIEARWETTVKDDRGNFYFATDNLSEEDNKQNIYFYNRFNGSLKNLPNNTIPYLKVLDEQGNELIANVSTTNVSTGIYKACISLTGSGDNELTDIWYSGSQTYFSSKIQATERVFEDTLADDEYVLNLTNLKNTYSQKEFPVIRVFARKRNWNPNIYKTSNNIIDVLTLNNLYFKVYRIVDNYTILDYGIEPIAYTKCSYDKNGNYFDLDMSIFQPGYAYGIRLMVLDGDIRKEYKQVFRFKVE